MNSLKWFSYKYSVVNTQSVCVTSGKRGIRPRGFQPIGGLILGALILRDNDPRGIDPYRVFWDNDPLGD